jgi:pSer/pThr/pTyr-binding forkhead associated (FHA) protein
VDPVTGIHQDVDLTTVDTKRSISRRHARLRREEDGSFSVIEDVGTMNGTFVNGVRLTAGRPFPVMPGDTVVFGTVQCRFEVDAVPSPPPVRMH